MIESSETAQNSLARDDTLPRISVVTPSYNQGRFLKWAIESGLFQDYPDLEYIVANGGSTDSSVEVTESCKEHPAFRFLEHPGMWEGGSCLRS
jgi:cellulose synthase/poly-beta-1,6-N-acetylglucosamine synthase-like glycosyltransferase